MIPVASDLPLRNVVLATYATVLTGLGPFATRLAPWYGMIALAALLRIVLGIGLGFETPAIAWLDRLWTGLGFLAGLLFALSWNRAILLRQGIGQDSPRQRRTFHFLALVIALAAAALASGFVAVALVSLLGAIGLVPRADSLPAALLGIVGLLGAAFAAARLLPALALAALDYPGSSLAAAYRLTRGHGALLFAGLLAVLVPALLARSLFVLLATLTGDPASETVLRLIATGFTFLAVALGTGFGACSFIALWRPKAVT